MGRGAQVLGSHVPGMMSRIDKFCVCKWENRRSPQHGVDGHGPMGSRSSTLHLMKSGVNILEEAE